MGFRKINSKVQVAIIIAIVLSVTGTAIFLGWRFRPIKIIEIYEDKDFSRKYHFPGKGTEEDPYIIEGYELSGNPEYNIKISGVTKHFIIRNCVLEKSYESLILSDRHGLNDGGIAKIVNNTIRDNDYGICLYRYEDCIISNNTFLNNNRTIFAYRGSYTVKSNIFDNSIYDPDSYSYGVILGDAHKMVLENNTFNFIKYGFSMSSSNNILVKQNNFQNCYSFACRLYSGTNITIANNSAINSFNDGFVFIECQNLNLVNNTATDNKESGFVLNSINNCLITGNNGSRNGYYGIDADELTNSNCRNNFFHGNNVSGIRINDSDVSTINNNSIADNGIGMELSSSNIMEISWNTIQHNLEYGVVTKGVNTIIFNNNFINNNHNNNPEIHSQAKVDGNCIDYVGYPVWYDEIAERGNYWSELIWYEGVEYEIDPGNYTDSYPLEYPVEIKS